MKKKITLWWVNSTLRFEFNTEVALPSVLLLWGLGFTLLPSSLTLLPSREANLLLIHCIANNMALPTNRDQTPKSDSTNPCCELVKNLSLSLTSIFLFYFTF